MIRDCFPEEVTLEETPERGEMADLECGKAFQTEGTVRAKMVR